MSPAVGQHLLEVIHAIKEAAAEVPLVMQRRIEQLASLANAELKHSHAALAAALLELANSRALASSLAAEVEQYHALTSKLVAMETSLPLDMVQRLSREEQRNVSLACKCLCQQQLQQLFQPLLESCPTGCLGIGSFCYNILGACSAATVSKLGQLLGDLQQLVVDPAELHCCYLDFASILLQATSAQQLDGPVLSQLQHRCQTKIQQVRAANAAAYAATVAAEAAATAAAEQQAYNQPWQQAAWSTASLFGSAEGPAAAADPFAAAHTTTAAAAAAGLTGSLFGSTEAPAATAADPFAAWSTGSLFGDTGAHASATDPAAAAFDSSAAAAGFTCSLFGETELPAAATDPVQLDTVTQWQRQQHQHQQHLGCMALCLPILMRLQPLLLTPLQLQAMTQQQLGLLAGSLAVQQHLLPLPLPPQQQQQTAEQQQQQRQRPQQAQQQAWQQQWGQKEVLGLTRLTHRRPAAQHSRVLLHG